jgi:hypothetical protein
MAFMKRQIVEQDWIEVDTAQGIWTIPAELLPNVVAAFADESIEDILEEDGIADSILQYTEAYKADQIYNVELRHGFGARLSAPGYMDCTDWTVFDTEDEATAYLDENYPEDDDDDSDEDQ